MFTTSELIKQKINTLSNKWERKNKKGLTDIELLAQEREHKAVQDALQNLQSFFAKRETIPILTSENTEVEWVDGDKPHGILRHNNIEIRFDRISTWDIRIIDDDYSNEISFNRENNFLLFDRNYNNISFFIEVEFVKMLSNKAETFCTCDECGNILNDCECCGECGKYECECDYCEHCGERDCDGECEED